MRAVAEKGLFKWAFGSALVLHVMALAAAARLPPGRAHSGVLGDIRVFSDAAPTFAAVVEMVQLPAVPQSVDATELVLPAPPAPTARPTAVPRPAAPVPESLQPARAVPPPKAPRPAAGSARAGAGGNPPVPEILPAGGGGPVDLGSPSPQGDLPGLPGGQTAPGSVPGDGTRPGSGVGQGAGTDTPGGSGTGPGPGQGSSQAAGGGSDSQGGETPGRPGPTTTFVSRSADRSEPRLLRKVTPPSYPESAVADGVEGTVKMKVLVTETGAVAEVEIVSSSGDRRLDAAAKECVRQWRYRPAVQNGKPRRVHTLATVKFELE